MIIAIDGPSGAGKSTIAKAVAGNLGFSCLDTGAMYRSVAWKALDSGVPLNDALAVTHIAREYPISFGHAEGDPTPRQVFIGDYEVTQAIRTAEIDHCVSTVSAIPAVREAMVVQQRRIAQEGDYVVEGRDIGVTVFPNAEVKVFLTASDEERARRRVKQNEERGIGLTDFDQVLEEIERRDQLDSSREASPLRAAEDAITIDSTDYTLEEVIAQVCSLANQVREA